jgi:flagellar basal body-associated protein FliL
MVQQTSPPKKLGDHNERQAARWGQEKKRRSHKGKIIGAIVVCLIVIAVIVATLVWSNQKKEHLPAMPDPQQEQKIEASKEASKEVSELSKLNTWAAEMLCMATDLVMMRR